MATITNNYWNHTGKYQKEYDAAWEALVPNKGEAEDGLPEALRSIARIYYDYYNNGFMNAHTFEQGEWDDMMGDYEQERSSTATSKTASTTCVLTSHTACGVNLTSGF